MIGTSFEGCFGDSRLDNRGKQLHSRLFSNATRSIQAMSSSRAEQKAFYRFLQNDKTSEQKLIGQLATVCSQRSAGKVVLSIQDTTEINLSSHKGRLKQGSGIGGIDDSKGIGFKLHPSFVVDAMTCFPIGFSDMRIWYREPGMANKLDRQYERLPIEEKESFKWTESSNKTKAVLSGAKAIIIVQDREGDIFSQFASIPDERTYLLIRSRVNRSTTEEGKLWDALSASAPLGRYELEVPRDSHSKQPARTATMEVRGKRVMLKCPAKDKANKGRMVEVYAVEALEIDNDDAIEPIHWLLLTTWPVNCMVDALTVIEWYSWRWLIEEVFRVLKKECFDIEGSELESGWAIRKLSILMLDTVVKLMQMHIAYNCPEGEDPDASMIFTENEQECLKVLEKKVTGSTEKLKNPHNAGRLKWAVWIIARIGGWKGYSSQRPPGMTTLFKGLEKFNLLYEGWSLSLVGTR